MRILMTADPVGGVWSYALELCAALAQDGVRVALATLGGEPSSAQLDQVARLPNVELFTSAYRLEWMPQPWDDLRRAGKWLLSLEKALRPDLIHLNHLVHADLPWDAPVLTVAHSCVLSWWAAVRRTPIPAEWLEYRTCVTRSLQAARCVVAPTRAILAQLENLYGPFRARAVIHNARDARRYTSPPTKERLILSAGRVWDAAKNVDALLAIAPQVRAPVVIAGATRNPCGSTDVRIDQSLRAAVTLEGHLSAERLSEWYARAAIYALPARYEPFGLTALEAALSGCALVLGDIPTLHEVWGDAACYVSPDDHGGLRDALNAMLIDDAARTDWAERAMARARRFNPERFARRYLSLYHALGARRRRAAASRPAATAATC
jgi:glycosyltransferase involved in cell wall biosynthesis